MRLLLSTIRHIQIVVCAGLLSVGMVAVGGAQSQEPKPELLATPVAESDLASTGSASSGVSGSSWRGPTWGVGVSWDPDAWTVEAEFTDESYDGVQLTTGISTAYIEAYERFDGDAAACLADAAQEIAAREGISEVVPLTDRPLPVSDDVRGDAELFGLTVTLPDGTVLRAVEYVECRTIVPGTAVLELTWQTVTGAFNEDFPNVEALFAAIETPEVSRPEATPVAPQATPVA